MITLRLSNMLNAAAAIVAYGLFTAAAEEERFVRTKRSTVFSVIEVEWLVLGNLLVQQPTALWCDT
jgi:predicted NodU family carbamoyl transferase